MLSEDKNKLTIRARSVDLQTAYEYDLQYGPFQLEQRVNGATTMIVNKYESMLFEGY
jgi:hypothetical protein